MKTEGNSFPEIILGWMPGGKAAEGCRSPKPGGNSERRGEREASWSAPALWRFGRRREGGRIALANRTDWSCNPHFAIRIPQWKRADWSRRNPGVAASRQSAANFRREFKWRLSPESRYAEDELVAPTRHGEALRRRKSDEGGRDLYS